MKTAINEATIWTQLERNFEPREDALRPGLESCGLAADDTATILSGIATGQRLAELARQISAGQILTKRTAQGRRHFLPAIKRRYLNAPSPLPGIKEVAAVLPALTSRTAKNQVLLPYLLLSDRTAFEIVRSTILPCRQHGETRLLKDHILAALYTVFRRHGRKPWGKVDEAGLKKVFSWKPPPNPAALFLDAQTVRRRWTPPCGSSLPERDHACSARASRE